MEKLADDGMLAGVVDVTTTEVCDLLLGGVLSAGPDRLGAIARTRLPYVGSVRRARHGELLGPGDRARALPRAHPLPAQPERHADAHDAEEAAASAPGSPRRLNACDGPGALADPRARRLGARHPGRRLPRPGRGRRALRRPRGGLARPRTAASSACRSTSTTPPSPTPLVAACREIAREAAHARHPPRRHPEEVPRAWWRPASRSSAAAPAPAFPRNARRPAASTSSSSTTPAATAWPAAAPPPGCSPSATPTPSSGRWRSRCCRWSATRPVLAGVNGTDPFVLMRPFLAELKAIGLLRRAELPDHRPLRRHDARRASRRPAWATASRST